MFPADPVLSLKAFQLHPWRAPLTSLTILIPAPMARHSLCTSKDQATDLSPPTMALNNSRSQGTLLLFRRQRLGIMPTLV